MEQVTSLRNVQSENRMGQAVNTRRGVVTLGKCCDKLIVRKWSVKPPNIAMINESSENCEMEGDEAKWIRQLTRTSQKGRTKWRILTMAVWLVGRDTSSPKLEISTRKSLITYLKKRSRKIERYCGIVVACDGSWRNRPRNLYDGGHVKSCYDQSKDESRRRSITKMIMSLIPIWTWTWVKGGSIRNDLRQGSEQKVQTRDTSRNVGMMFRTYFQNQVIADDQTQLTRSQERRPIAHTRQSGWINCSR